MPFSAPGEPVTIDFTTRNPVTKALANADSTPTGTLVRNGTDDSAVTVTITNKATGRYKAAFTIPSTYEVGDEVDLFIAVTVGGVSDGDVIWRSTLEAAVAAPPSGYITDNQLLTYFAAIGYKAGSMQLWPTLVARANLWAKGQIANFLGARGYSAAQIVASDQVTDWNYNLGCFNLLNLPAVRKANEGLRREDMEYFDCREELKTCVLTEDQTVIDPEGPFGQAATGQINGETDDDMAERWSDARPDWLRNSDTDDVIISDN